MDQTIDINNKSSLRWLNWSDFIKQIEGNKKNSFCIMSLLYNNIENTQFIINKLSQESQKDNIDIIIMDNSDISLYDTLNLKGCNIIYIRPTQNLGSAGGYALGMEYIIDQGYDYFCMIEDDIILLDNETFTETYLVRKKDRIIFINSCLNTGGEHSWYVQYACYPVEFVKKIGIIDPRYFFRSEDLERRIRIDEGIKKYRYEKFILNKNYYHPYLKKINGSAAWSYFSLRNQFFMLQKHLLKENFLIFITAFLYLWNGCVRSLFLGQYQYLKASFYAIYDFIVGNWGLYWSTLRTQQFSKKYNIGINEQTINITKLSNNSQFSLFYGKYMFSNIDLGKLKKSKGLNSSSIIVGGRNIILYPFFVIFPTIVSIDEFILGTDNIIVSYYYNSYAFLKGFISFLIGIFLIPFYIILFIILILKISIAGLQYKNR